MHFKKNMVKLYLLGIVMLGLMVSGCGSVNGLNIERTGVAAEKAISTIITSDRHSWNADGFIASMADDEVVYTALESGKLKNADLIKKDIVITCLGREVKIFLVLQDTGNGIRIVDQSVQYDAFENDEEIYGGDVYIELRRIGDGSEDILLYAGISQSDSILQCQIVSVNQGNAELLVTDDINQYIEEINDIIVADDKNYVFFSGSKFNRRVLIKKNLNTGAIYDLTEIVGINSEMIELHKTDDFVCITVDGQQIWKMKMSDSYPVRLMQYGEMTDFQFTAGKYLVTGSDGVFQELFNIQTGEYIKLPKTFDRESTSVISNKASTKIMFITESDNVDLGYLMIIEVYDIETGKLIKMSDGKSDLPEVTGISWFDNNRIILRGTDKDKIAYEILEEKNEE